MNFGSVFICKANFYLLDIISRKWRGESCPRIPWESKLLSNCHRSISQLICTSVGADLWLRFLQVWLCSFAMDFDARSLVWSGSTLYSAKVVERNTGDIIVNLPPLLC